MSNFSVLAGYGYDENGAYLRIDQHNSGSILREKKYLKDQSIFIEKKMDRHCTGWFDLKTLSNHECPNSAKLLSPKSNQCFNCFDATGFNPAFYHLDQHQISPQQRAYNQTEHIVYLAYFASGLVKVGISSNDRKEHRWKEQGARFVAHILTLPNAYDARHFEEKISSALKLPEVVLGKKKRSILSFEMNLNSVKNELLSTIDRIEEKIDVNCRKDQIYSMDEYYNFNDLKLDRNIVDISESIEIKISGKCLGLFGDILVFENNGMQFMCSLKKLITYKVVITDKVEKMNFEPKQTSLF